MATSDGSRLGTSRSCATSNSGRPACTPRRGRTLAARPGSLPRLVARGYTGCRAWSLGSVPASYDGSQACGAPGGPFRDPEVCLAHALSRHGRPAPGPAGIPAARPRPAWTAARCRSRTWATGCRTGTRPRTRRRRWPATVAPSHSRAARKPRSAKPGAAGVPVVDEDGQPAGGRVQVGRHAADVPAVAGGDQRQQADRRRARRRAPRRAGPRRAPARRRAGPAEIVHHTALVRRVRGGRSSGTSPIGCPVSSRRRAKETTWRVTIDVAETDLGLAPGRPAQRRGDLDAGQLPGRGGVAGIAGVAPAPRTRPGQARSTRYISPWCR